MKNSLIHCSYSNQSMQEAWNLITQAKKIVLLTHEEPDEDGVSACAAFEYVLEKSEKEVEVVYPDQPQGICRFQPKNVLTNKHHMVPDLLIALDTANYKRMYFPDVFKKIPLINIDHHVSNSINGTYNFVNPAASSACEELFVLIQQWSIKLIDSYVAACLLYGILFDSQVFHTNSTTSRTMRIAAELMDYGVDMLDLENVLLSSKGLDVIGLWGMILRTVKTSKRKNAAWVCITQSDLKEYGITVVALSGFTNFLIQIADVDIVVVFYEKEKNTVKVSMRSKSTDVNAIAAQFGGGGHKNAAGITIKKPFAQVVAEVTAKL